MKKNKQILLVSLLLISFLDAQRLGYGSAGFLKRGMSARAISMGSAYTALVDDPSAVFWNPAGLLNKKEFQVQISDLQDDIFNFNSFIHMSRFGPFGSISGQFWLQLCPF